MTGALNAAHRRLKELAGSGPEPISQTLRRDRVTREFEPLTLDGLQQAIKTISAEAEIGKKVVPETFRHSYCRTMLLKGNARAGAGEADGHGSDRMIRLHYGKIESQQANAMAMRLLKDDSTSGSAAFGGVLSPTQAKLMTLFQRLAQFASDRTDSCMGIASSRLPFCAEPNG